MTNVLLTSGGRRVALARAFRQSLAGRGSVTVADMSPVSSAYHDADHQELVPRCTAPDYVDSLLAICQRREIGLVVPLIDTELPVLAAARDRFDAAGVTLVACGPQTIAIANDKRETARFFAAKDIVTPALLDPEKALAGELAFPIFIKPLDGSMSIGSRRLESMEDLRYWWPRTRNPMLMECATGIEYTIDVYSGLDGVPRCAVPRRRVEVRAGEVSKGLTEAVDVVMQGAMTAAAALPDAVGVLTFQCLLGDDGVARFFELNARFGGGAPLSIAAGADFPAWLLMEHEGKRPKILSPGFRPRTLMLRFDDAVFIDEGGRWIS